MLGLPAVCSAGPCVVSIHFLYKFRLCGGSRYKTAHERDLYCTLDLWTDK